MLGEREYVMNDGRRKPYKRDSTEGDSVLDPLNYKGDVLVQLWIDGRVLATLSSWLDSQGIYTRHLSEVTRLPLKYMVDMLVGQGDVNMIDDTAEARLYLHRKYGVKLNTEGRGRKNVIHNMALSDKRGELGYIIESHERRRIEDISIPKNSGDKIAD